MFTMLGYEEARRLHEERVGRSLARYRVLHALRTCPERDTQRRSTGECEVRDLPRRAERLLKIGP
ncbi:MAG TPA: hypothetical protein VF246_08135 [Acidimicrobiia bacterium]